MRLIIHGGGGRMGLRVVAAASRAPEWSVVGALTEAEDPRCGRDVGQLAGGEPIGVPLTCLWPSDVEADVAIDFSVPSASSTFVQEAARRGTGVVVATTGFSPAQRDLLAEAAAHIPIVVAANLSWGVMLLKRLAAVAASELGLAADVEVVDTHHRFKRDAPSGTALELAEVVATARDQDLSTAIHCGRSGLSSAPRAQGEIGMHALRCGDVVGEHTVTFAFGSERVAITHAAHSRNTFALGALRAAAFVAVAAPGLYDAEEALGGGAGGGR